MKNSKLLLFIPIFTCVAILSAQQSFTLYPMRSVPQSNLLNPALIPDCKWFVGIPALNSTSIMYANGGFNLRNVFNALEESGTNTNVINLNKLLDVFGKKNYITLKTELSFLQGGLRYKKHYLHFSMIEKAQLQLSIPKDLFRFIIDGNGGDNLGSTFNFQMKATAMHYRETGIGYSYQLTDKLNLGARVKFLGGYNYIGTKTAYLDFTTDQNDFSYKLKANLEINSASTHGEIIAYDSNSAAFEPTGKGFTSSKNRGLALDLGGTYKITDKLSINASILDIGYIRWKQNAVSLVSKRPNATFHYDGLHISSNDRNTFDEFVEGVMDTLKSTFDVETRRKSFNTALSTEFFIGGNYTFNKHLSVGAIFYGDYFNKRFYPGFTMNALWKAGRSLSVNITNTMYQKSWINVGLGVSTGLGPVQVYSVIENVLWPITFGRTRLISWRFGANLTFGRERMKPKKPKKNKSDGNSPGGETWPG